ncbi:MAG: ATP-independent RNA helicase DbpA [Lysobacterales bacterium]|jgi:ATP-independent RNA helicase DbpA
MSSNDFKSVGLSPEILKNVDLLGYTVMTPIQALSLPIILQKRDLIAQAKTGSGKTAAFGLGIMAKIKVDECEPQALILCPTRELAEQVSVEMRRLARSSGNVKVLSLVGGESERHQKKSLVHGSHIIVGTPGRVLKFLEQGVLSIKNVRTFVLDEADRMLDLGFHNDITTIATYAPPKRQTLLFSATFQDTIKELSNNVQKNAEHIKVDVKHKANQIEEYFFEVQNTKNKKAALFHLLDYYRPETALIFCETKATCKQLSRDLNNRRVCALSIQGDLDQRDRNLVLTKFSNNSASVLVGTDVAARGLDIKDLSAVINFDLPVDAETYVHRIGRTGRAGKSGLALTLTVERNSSKLAEIEAVTGEKARFKELKSLIADEEYDMIPPMATVFISAGRKNGLRPGDILGALTKEGGLAGSDVGDIRIFDVNTYVAIKLEKIDIVLEYLKSGKVKGRKVKAGRV